MEKHILSKSTFLRGLQCTKSLYLYKNFIQLRDPVSAEQQSIFSRGSNVGILAQQLFPGGTDATPVRRSDNLAAVARTQELIAAGAEIIYEAAFQHEQVLAILDILIRKEGKWYGFEVKSSTRITNTYLLDASLQYWVISNSGLPLADISIITVNNQYVKSGELDLKGLFSFRSVKKEALQGQQMIASRIAELKKVALDPQMPDVKIAEQCFSPYTCDFTGNCWKNVPKGSVFEMTGVARADQFALYNAGFRTIGEIPAENALDRFANIHIGAVKNNSVVTDEKAIRAFLDKAAYPLFFMDFETFMPAVPLYDGTKPYQHIPFQYSIHYKKTRESEPEHVEFLAEQGLDPRKAFLLSLLEHTGAPGTLLVYDALMERNVLNGLKKDFPEYSAAIDARLERILDLIIPFQERSYYHPAMKNSVSIKNVLPALVPDLSYNGLKISSGSMAMIAYEQLGKETDMFRILEVREQLLDYCRMDTLAMVKLFEALEQSVKK